MLILTWFNGANLPIAAVVASIVTLVVCYFYTATGRGWRVGMLFGVPAIFGLINNFWLMCFHGSLSQDELRRSFAPMLVTILLITATYVGMVLAQAGRVPGKYFVGATGTLLGAITAALRLIALTPKAGHKQTALLCYHESLFTGYGCLLLVAAYLGLVIREYVIFWKLEAADRAFTASSYIS